ncbi:MAG: hypothetical protein PHF33_08990 [Candidatus Delongbacteria bacterium]|nr:hypothetical protein [Candidatus Delongbacteria bacterium]
MKSSIPTTQEERLFMASLTEKVQRDSLEEEDLAAARDYFFLKKTVAKRCFNIPPHFKKIKGADKEGGVVFEGEGRITAPGSEDPKKISNLLKELSRFFSYASRKEMSRLAELEDYVMETYFKDRFYMLISKIQGALESMDRKKTRVYRNRVDAANSVVLEYRISDNKSDPASNIFRGVDARVLIKEKGMPLSEFCSYIALVSKFPDMMKNLQNAFEKEAPELASVAEQVRLPEEAIKYADISFTCSERENEEMGKPEEIKKIEAISCPKEVMEFIADEVLICLTSTFLGRNIAIAETMAVEQELTSEEKGPAELVR